MKELITKTAELDWEAAKDYQTGTERKVLRQGDKGEPRTVLLKLPPGFEMTAHSHLYTEHHYVLEGRYESQGTEFPAGTYRVIPRHKNHGPFTSATGAVVLIIWAE